MHFSAFLCPDFPILATPLAFFPASQQFRPAMRFFFLIRKRVAISSAFWYNRLTQ